jgi:DNA-binding transcriptional regulator YhcF (GntR family)
MGPIPSSCLDYSGRKYRLPAHIVLARELRERILSRELKPGHRFPATKLFAAQRGTYPLAVHEAFKILSNEGLVARLHRSGTFVSSNSATLGSVAIYLGCEIMGPRHMEFVRLVYAELVRGLKAEGVSHAALLDPRPDAEVDRPWELLVKALEKRQYQAVIALCNNQVRMKWLATLGVPLACLSDTRTRFDEFAEKSARALKEDHCRSAGLIANFPKDSEVAGRIKDAVRQNGMEFRDDWHVFPEGKFLPGPELERFGYEGFLRIWSLQERPEGLIIYPDAALAGIAAALVGQKVSVPEDLKLAAHMNRGSEISFPFEATMIVFDPAEAAAAVLRQLRRKLAGETLAAEEIGFRLRKNQPGTSRDFKDNQETGKHEE